MSTDLPIDDRLLAKAIEAGHHATAEEAVTTALEEYVHSHARGTNDAADRQERLKILELMGKVDYFEDYDPKELRRRNVL